MNTFLVFSPLVPLPLIGALAVLMGVTLALAVQRRLTGWFLRTLAILVVFVALLSPRVQQEDREGLSDIAIVAVDKSGSQRLSDREAASEAAFTAIERQISRLEGTEIRRVDIGDGAKNSGTLAMAALAKALNAEPQSRIAGTFLISDGRVHDIEQAPDMPAPFHLLLTGEETDWDRQVVIENAPAYAILDETITLTVRIDDKGAVPSGLDYTSLEIAIDGAEPLSFEVPVGQPIELPIDLRHAGRNVIMFSVPEATGELTTRNNMALVEINGVRDRLRVLLVSGEPHPGSRTWRNLLKSDSSVDLVHFTILRPPEKQDGVPVGELSLIAFPTRELFLEKISDFDLIVFDRYKRRGILPSIYLDNVRSYVEQGGAVLVAAGPDFASADSIYRSPLSEILPAAPTARVIERGYHPKVSEAGRRHPVTSSLPTDDAAVPSWGRWMRQVEVVPPAEGAGHVVMSGFEDMPLLLLNRVEDGRVALLASDHAWLWSRGFEGGGPQLELLRRLAHWMMKEPELEEEALEAEAIGSEIRITRRTMSDTVDPVEVTDPEGNQEQLTIQQTSPGVFEGNIASDKIGLHRLVNGDQSAVVGLGPASPREFRETIADAGVLAPIIERTEGGVRRIQEGVPLIRKIGPGRPATGRGWMGITRRDAYLVKGISSFDLLPAWLALLLTAGFVSWAWLRESRS